MTLFHYVVSNIDYIFALDGVKVLKSFENKEEKPQNLQSI
jgi:hypothetical protein